MIVLIEPPTCSGSTTGGMSLFGDILAELDWALAADSQQRRAVADSILTVPGKPRGVGETPLRALEPPRTHERIANAAHSRDPAVLSVEDRASRGISPTVAKEGEATVSAEQEALGLSEGTGLGSAQWVGYHGAVDADGLRWESRFGGLDRLPQRAHHSVARRAPFRGLGEGDPFHLGGGGQPLHMRAGDSFHVRGEVLSEGGKAASARFPLGRSKSADSLRGHAPGVGDSRSFAPGVGDSRGLAPGVGDSRSLAPGVGDSRSFAPGVGDSRSLAPGVGDSRSLAPGVGGSRGLAPGVGDSRSFAPGVGDSRSLGSFSFVPDGTLVRIDEAEEAAEDQGDRHRTVVELFNLDPASLLRDPHEILLLVRSFEAFRTFGTRRRLRHWRLRHTLRLWTGHAARARAAREEQQSVRQHMAAWKLHRALSGWRRSVNRRQACRVAARVLLERTARRAALDVLVEWRAAALTSHTVRMFRQLVLMRSARSVLWAWRNEVAEAAAAAQVADMLKPARKASLLAQWRASLHRVRHMRAAVEEMRALAEVRNTARLFHRMRSFAASSRSQVVWWQKVAATMHHRERLRQLGELRQARRRALDLTLLGIKCQRVVQRRRLLSWRDATRRTIGHRQILFRVRMRLAVRKWRGWTHRRVDAERRVMPLVRAAHNRRMAAWVMTHWARRLKVAQWVSRMDDKAGRIHRLGTLRKGLVVWVARTYDRLRQRRLDQLRNTLEAVVARNSGDRALVAWRLALMNERQRERLATQHWRTRSLRHALMRVWRSRTRRSWVDRAHATMAADHMKLVQLRHAFKRFHRRLSAVVRLRRFLQRCGDLIASQSMARLAKRSVAQWRLRVQARELQRANCERVLAQRVQRRRVAAALSWWKSLHRRQRRIRHGTLWLAGYHDALTQRRGLTRWRSWLRLKKQWELHALSVRVALQRRRLFRVMFQWRLTTLANQRVRAGVARMLLRHDAMLSFRVFQQWVALHLRLRAQQRAVRAAVAHTNARLLSEGFRRWSLNSIELARLRVTEGVVSRHHTARVSRKVLRCWALRLHALRLDRARAVLADVQRTRRAMHVALSHWHTWLGRRRHLHALEWRADCFRKRALLVKSWMGWKVFFRSCQRLSRTLAVLRAMSQVVSLREHIGAWRQALRHKRLSDRLVALGAAHHRRVAISRALVQWSVSASRQRTHRLRAIGDAFRQLQVLRRWARSSRESARCRGRALAAQHVSWRHQQQRALRLWRECVEVLKHERLQEALRALLAAHWRAKAIRAERIRASEMAAKTAVVRRRKQLALLQLTVGSWRLVVRQTMARRAAAFDECRVGLGRIRSRFSLRRWRSQVRRLRKLRECRALIVRRHAHRVRLGALRRWRQAAIRHLVAALTQRRAALRLLSRCFLRWRRKGVTDAFARQLFKEAAVQNVRRLQRRGLCAFRARVAQKHRDAERMAVARRASLFFAMARGMRRWKHLLDWRRAKQRAVAWRRWRALSKVFLPWKAEWSAASATRQMLGPWFVRAPFGAIPGAVTPCDDEFRGADRRSVTRAVSPSVLSALNASPGTSRSSSIHAVKDAVRAVASPSHRPTIPTRLIESRPTFPYSMIPQDPRGYRLSGAFETALVFAATCASKVATTDRPEGASVALGRSVLCLWRRRARLSRWLSLREAAASAWEEGKLLIRVVAAWRETAHERARLHAVGRRIVKQRESLLRKAVVDRWRRATVAGWRGRAHRCKRSLLRLRANVLECRNTRKARAFFEHRLKQRMVRRWVRGVLSQREGDAVKFQACLRFRMRLWLARWVAGAVVKRDTRLERDPASVFDPDAHVNAFRTERSVAPVVQATLTKLYHRAQREVEKQAWLAEHASQQPPGRAQSARPSPRRLSLQKRSHSARVSPRQDDARRVGRWSDAPVLREAREELNKAGATVRAGGFPALVAVDLSSTSDESAHLPTPKMSLPPTRETSPERPRRSLGPVRQRIDTVLPKPAATPSVVTSSSSASSEAQARLLRVEQQRRGGRQRYGNLKELVTHVKGQPPPSATQVGSMLTTPHRAALAASLRYRAGQRVAK
jgi:hypothetical protein